MESITIGRWMEAKILKLRRNRKKEIFGFLTCGSAGFSKKSVLTEKSGKNFSHPPTPFCAPEWAALIRPWSGGSRGDQGLFFLFGASQEKFEFKFPGNSNFRKNLFIEEFRVSHSFWDFSIRDRIYSQPRTTKGFESVRVGTRMTTNDDESQESFSNPSNESVLSRSEKAEDF